MDPRAALDGGPGSHARAPHAQVEFEDLEFPLDFRYPTATPPIKGFNPQDFAKD